MILIALIFLADSMGVDTTLVNQTRADTLMLKSAFVECRMQTARIDNKLDSALVKLKNQTTLKKVKAKVKKP